MTRFAVGTDIVAIARCTPWQQQGPARLHRLFSQEELTYAFSSPAKTAQRLAVRFAAREAFFKALHTLFPTARIPLFTVLRNVNVTKLQNGAPQLSIHWPAFQSYGINDLDITASISLSHTHDMAMAIVIINRA